MAALLSKKEEVKYVNRKVNFEEEVFNDLKKYIEFIGMDDKKEIEGTSYVTNEALKYIFTKDKDFKKYLEDLESKTKDEDGADNQANNNVEFNS